MISSSWYPGLEVCVSVLRIMSAIPMKLVVLSVYWIQNATETKLASAANVETHALEHVDRMPDVMLLTIFQHARVLQGSLEIHSQTVDKPCQVGFLLIYAFDAAGCCDFDDDDIYAKRLLQG